MFHRPTLAEFLPQYQNLHPGISQARMLQLRATVNAIDRWMGRAVALRDLSEALISEFLSEFSHDHAGVTCNTKRSHLLALWRTAYSQRLVRRLPDRIPRLRELKRVPEAWTAQEVSTIIAFCRSLKGTLGDLPRCWWWSSIIGAGYWTGSRASALLKTQTTDCSLSQRWLIVRAEGQKTGQDQLFKLPPQCIDLIAPIYSSSRKLLWPWPYHPQTFWRQLRRILEDAGFHPSKRGMDLFQRLRRTAVSYAARESLELARRLAGHSSTEMTRRHYLDERIATVPSAADVLPRLDI